MNEFRALVKTAVILGVACLSALAAGCSSQKTSQPGATQVVARVNGHELTVSQLNAVLAQTSGSDVGAAEIQRAVANLVDQELLVQGAIDSKLDRDPEVLLQLDAARRQILARAFEDRHLYPSTPITESDLRKFYDNNPALFGARRIYHLTALTTQQSNLPAALKSDLSQARTLNSHRDLLTRYNVSFNTEDEVKAAEAMPLELVPRLAGANVGDAIVVEDKNQPVEILSLTEIENSPLTLDQARSAITHFLRLQRNEAAVGEFLRRAQAVAKIEYFGSFGSAPKSDQLLQN